MSPIIEILRDTDAQMRIADEWDKAVPESFQATLSRSAWYFAWRDAFSVKESVIVTARDDGRLVGVLPISKIRTDARGLFFPQITTYTGADYQAPVIAEGAANDILPCMVDAAIDHFGKMGVYWWANIPTNDMSADTLAAHLSSRGMRIYAEYRVAPRLLLSHRSYAEIESTWSASHRTDVRRQRKRLEKAGAISLSEPRDRAAARTLLEEFFTVHDEKWRSQGQPGMFHESRHRNHFRAIVDRLWGRGLFFSVLRCDEVNVSYGFGFFSGGWIQWYRPTYRREYQNFSPGKVHIALLVEEACKRGWNGVDFLQGAETYKQQWSNEQIRTVDYYAACTAWSPGYQWFARGKPFVRERLGSAYARFRARLQGRFVLRDNQSAD